MKVKVLIVDDDRQTCDMIQAILVSAGMDAQGMTDNVAAAERLAMEKFDLLFLDVHMPAPNGMDMLQTLRAAGVNRRTAVVLMTGDQDPKLLSQGFRAGANYFLFKPIELNRLMRVVRAADAAVFQERRRFQRVSVSRKVTIHCKGEKLAGMTLDMSLGGMMVRAERVLPQDSYVDVVVEAKPKWPSVQAQARVARVLDDGCMGLEFLRLEARDSERLQQFLLPIVLDALGVAAPSPPNKVLA